MVVAVAVALAAGACRREVVVAPAVSARAVGTSSLALIPADTPYVFATLEPMNKALRDRIWRVSNADLVASVEKLDDGSDQPMARIARAFVAELRDGARVRDFDELGFASGGRFALYGLSIWPVLRAEVADGARLRAVAARVLGAAGAEVKQQTRDGYTYWVAGSATVSVVAAVLDREAVLAVLPTSALARSLPLLFGTERPAVSLAQVPKLAEVARRHGLLQTWIGYVDVKLVVDILTGRTTGVNYDLAAAARGALGWIGPCHADLERIAAFVPRMAMGYRALDLQGFDGGLYIETPAAVNAALASFRASVPELGTATGERPLFALTIAAQVDALQAWIKDVADGIQARPFSCPALQPLTEAATGISSMLALPSPPMLQGLRGLALVVDDVSVSPLGGTGHVIIVGTGMDALVRWLWSLPVFAGATLPTLGIPVALPVQQLGVPGITAAHLARSSDRLAVAVGAESADRAARALSAPEQPSPLLSVSVDMVRLSARLGTDAATSLDRLGSASYVTMTVDATPTAVVLGVRGTWPVAAGQLAR